MSNLTKKFMSTPSKGPCPVCTGPIVDTLFTCGKCWWLLPGGDRSQLNNMRRRGQPTAAKLASVVKKFKEKQANDPHKT